MNSISAGTPEMSDLDGYSLPGDFNYSMQSRYGSGNADFGFDPPQNSSFSKSEHYGTTLSGPLQLSGWSGFETPDSKDATITNRLPTPDPLGQNMEFDRLLGQPVSNTSRAVSRFGQVTPPRSNSASSEEKISTIASPKINTTERRKRSTKAPIKEEPEAAPVAAAGRKRKNTRKLSTGKEEQDDKRRQSLEKNRLAAAKCRINKKEKTEQLQRNSHEKAVHNAFLKEQVMRMKEEVQQMNALLLAHANCEGCKSPEEIQKHLSNLGNEFFAQHMSSMNYEYSPVSLDDMPRLVQDPSMQHDYYSSSSGTPMLNPPLPEFDRAADFEVHTPMQTD